MPRGYVQLVIYLDSEEEREKIKAFCKQLGISVSTLVREFFRSLLEGGQKSIIINAGNKIEIGEINIDLKQNIAVQINNNIIALINMKLSDWLEEINKALKSRSLLAYNNTLIYLKQQIEELLNNIKLLSPRGR